MRTVVVTGPGKVELNYMWLPGFLAFNMGLRRELEQALGPKLVGRPLTEDVLDEAHDMVVDFYCSKFEEIDGLRDLLDAMKFVSGPKEDERERNV